MSGTLWLAALGWLAAACSPGLAASAADAASEPTSPLHVEVELGPPATVRALYLGDAPDGLTYRLVVLREGAAGRSESSQGGPVGVSDTLAVSRVSVAAGDRLSVRLTLSDGDAIIDSTAWSQTIEP